MGEGDKRIKIYFIDKPDFLSCGKAYFTDKSNKIVLSDSSSGR